MATVRTSASIDETPEGLRITMRVPRLGCVSVFLAAWLVGWAAGEIAALRLLFSMGISFVPVSAFILLWLVGWTVGGVLAVGTLLMTLDGREILSIGSGVISRRAEAFGRGLSWRYPLERCSNLRPTSGSDGVKGFISFDYVAPKGANTIRLGSGLTESSAEEIAQRVWAAFPDLMPPHERRKRDQAAAVAPRPPVAPQPSDADPQPVE